MDEQKTFDEMKKMYTDSGKHPYTHDIAVQIGIEQGRGGLDNPKKLPGESDKDFKSRKEGVEAGKKARKPK